jgi:hypothetical protein
MAALASGCRLVDAAGGGPAADAAPCLPVPAVVDDFEDGVVNAAWSTYADPGTSLEEADGVLRVLYSGTDTAWAGYVTAAAHDIRGGWLSAEVTQVGGSTILELNAGDTRVQTYADGGTLFGTVLVGTDTLSEFETDYLPEMHAYWRMREEAGWVHWETSPDGSSWTEMDARPTPLAAEAARLLLSGGGVEGDEPSEFGSAAAAVCPSLR